MALVTAGKQISVGNDKAYGRGLFIVDPDEAERKARKQAEYQQQLRMQMEEDRRRKQQKKRKEDEEDMRLQQKIKQDMKKQTDKKPDKTNFKNDKNSQPPPNRSQTFPSEPTRVEFKEKNQEEQQNYRFNLNNYIEPDRTENNPYLPRNFSLAQAEEERFFEESNSQKLKVMHEVLEQKLNQVFKKIKQSQDLEIDKEIDLIRKKIATSNSNYNTQNNKVQQFDGEISYFYKVPKKINSYSESRALPKNLIYDSASVMKRTTNQIKDFKPVTQQQIVNSRQLASRDSRNSSDERAWGAKKGKNNYLGNRQAMDFQINSLMGKIENMIQEQKDQ